MRHLRILVVSAVTLVALSCGTLCTITDPQCGGFRPYSGTRASARGHATQLDIPLSLVLDTLLLPASIPKALADEHARQKKLATGGDPAAPLSGTWILNAGRTHYGGGAERRSREIFTCESTNAMVRCTIESERVGGQRVSGSFIAAYDGSSYPTTGIPDVDSVQLRRVDAHVADTTFCSGKVPVFGYRATRSDDGRSLTIVAVDPTSRAVLNSVVVYDQR